jgi:hypothetical protein
MIRFSCLCRHNFEVHDDLAGSSIQCPKCGLLTDVPSLSDLESFTDEGTYRIDADRPIVDDAERLEDLGIVYAKDKRDAEGNEIDLRTLPAGRRWPGEVNRDDADSAEPLDFKDDAADITERPKYDPETGELIRPLDVRKDPQRDVNPASIPMATASNTISYARVDLGRSVNPLRLISELFMPMNLVVMFFIALMHVINGVIFIAAIGLFFLWPVWVIYQSLLLAHYGNVIDDTGRNDQDDLPRPLRDLSFYDDMWSPFVQMTGALMIAYAIPMIALAALFDRTGLPVELAWLGGWVVGAIAAPALLLTTNLSGSTLNLRPDRVLGVMRTCGLHYFGVVIAGAIAFPIYFVGWIGICVSLLDAFVGAGSNVALLLEFVGIPESIARNVFLSWLIVPAALLVGIYLMHYFCWYLGLLYKAHHDQFPWVLQRYIRDPSKRPRSTHADRLAGPGRPQRRSRPPAGHLIPPDLPQVPPPSAPRS